MKRFIFEENRNISQNEGMRLIGPNYHGPSGRIAGQLILVGEQCDAPSPAGGRPAEPQGGDSIMVRYMIESLSLMGRQLKSLEELSSDISALRGLLVEDMATREEERRRDIAGKIAAIVAVLNRAEKKSQQAATDMIDNQIGSLAENKSAIESYLKTVLTKLPDRSYLRPYIYNQLIVLAQIWAKIYLILGEPGTAKSALDECAETIKRDAKHFADALTSDVDPREFAPNDLALRRDLFQALEHIDDLNPLDRLCDCLEKIDRLPMNATLHYLNSRPYQQREKVGSVEVSLRDFAYYRFYRAGEYIENSWNSSYLVEKSGYLVQETRTYKSSEGNQICEELPAILAVPCKGTISLEAVNILIECGHLVSKAKSLSIEVGVALEDTRMADEFASIHLDYRD